MLTEINLARFIEGDHDYRIVATKVPANDVYSEKLVVMALPNLTDACPKVLGSLVVGTHPNFPTIEWVEVEADHRQQGIGRRLWNAAEKILGRRLKHMPVTDLGEKFADAMEAAQSSPDPK